MLLTQLNQCLKLYKGVKFRKKMLDGFNGSMLVKFIKEVLFILLNDESCYSYWRMLGSMHINNEIATHIDACYKGFRDKWIEVDWDVLINET